MHSTEERRSNRFGMTWGWLNASRIFIFEWTIPLSSWCYLLLLRAFQRHVKGFLLHLTCFPEVLLSCACGDCRYGLISRRTRTKFISSLSICRRYVLLLFISLCPRLLLIWEGIFIHPSLYINYYVLCVCERCPRLWPEHVAFVTAEVLQTSKSSIVVSIRGVQSNTSPKPIGKTPWGLYISAHPVWSYTQELCLQFERRTMDPRFHLLHLQEVS